jgi:phosphate transport system protein
LFRQGFHRELDRLVKDVAEFGREVQSCLDKAVEALVTRDTEMAKSECGIDSRFKERGVKIDEECLILQALQAPVASDLRLIHTTQAMTNHLVRAGTLCEHICHAIVETAGADCDQDLATTLAEMGRTARNLLRDGLSVFEGRDVEHAHDLEALDDKVDLLYAEAMNLVVIPTKEEAISPEWRVQAALIVHYLERIADHGVAIGESTASLVTGERMEAAMRQYRERRLEEPGE